VSIYRHSSCMSTMRPQATRACGLTLLRAV
jgi:hypothetical protein